MNDQFGVDVDLSGGRILVGARWYDDGAVDGGAAFLLVKHPGGWSLTGRLRPPSPELEAYFGTSVALRGTSALVGAPGSERAVNPGGSAALSRSSPSMPT